MNPAALSLIAVAGWTSGFSVYLTTALLGIGQRAGWVDLPGDLSRLEHPAVIAAALFLFFIEFFADKVPVVDSMWDAIHAFIRPAGAAALGFLGAAGADPLAQTFVSVVTGTIALDAHAVKASSRLAINTSPEPFSNVAASLVEQAAVVLLLWFCARHPFLAAALVAVFLAGSFFVLRALWRFARGLFPGPKRV